MRSNVQLVHTRRLRRLFMGGSFILLGFLAALPADARANLRQVSGVVEVEQAGAKRPARVGQEVPAGGMVMTGADGRVTLLLADGSTVMLGPKSRLLISRSAAATTAVALQSGAAVMRTSPYRWKSEVFQVATPVATAGVRGTEFAMTVSPTGEALLEVDRGEVRLGATAVPAGQAASALLTAPEAATLQPRQEGLAANWLGERRAAFIRNRDQVLRAAGQLLAGTAARRLQSVGVAFQSLQQLGKALALPEATEAEKAEKGVRVIEALRNGLEKIRAALDEERATGMREDLLRELLRDPAIPAGARDFATRVLAAAEKDRAKRELEIARLDKNLADVGTATVFLAAIAAADTKHETVSTRLIDEALGVPVRGEPLAGPAPVIDWEDLGWSAGRSWQMLRTLRGREELRVEIPIRLEAAGERLRMIREPEAFETGQILVISHADGLARLEKMTDLQGRALPGQGFLPLVLYRFPLTLGSHWVAWQLPGGKDKGLRVERRVVAAERLKTPAGEFDCLRLESRLRSPNEKGQPLLHVEWLSPGVGQVREILFRQGAMEWNERI